MGSNLGFVKPAKFVDDLIIKKVCVVARATQLVRSYALSLTFAAARILARSCSDAARFGSEFAEHDSAPAFPDNQRPPDRVLLRGRDLYCR